MAYDFDKLRSAYNYYDFCVCGGYYQYNYDQPLMQSDEKLHPVKCRICNKTNWAAPKEQNEDQAETD